MPGSAISRSKRPAVSASGPTASSQMPLVSPPRQLCACGLQVLAFIDLGVDLPPTRERWGSGETATGGEAVVAWYSDIEKRAPLGIDGGVGPIRHPVGAHTPGEFQPGVQRLLDQGLWTDAGFVALPERTGTERPAAGRVQVLAGSLGRPKLGIADPEYLRVGLRDLSVAVGVREVWHSVGANADRVGDR